MSWRKARSSPFNPSRIPLSEPGFASRAVPRRVKKKSVSVGQISHFLPRLALKEEACKASMLSWRQSLAHTRDGGSVFGCLKKKKKIQLFCVLTSRSTLQQSR